MKRFDTLSGFVQYFQSVITPSIEIGFLLIGSIALHYNRRPEADSASGYQISTNADLGGRGTGASLEMIWARQEARLAPVLYWLCPYYPIDGMVMWKEQRVSSRAPACCAPAHGKFEKHATMPHT